MGDLPSLGRLDFKICLLQFQEVCLILNANCHLVANYRIEYYSIIT